MAEIPQGFEAVADILHSGNDEKLLVIRDPNTIQMLRGIVGGLDNKIIDEKKYIQLVSRAASLLEAENPKLATNIVDWAIAGIHVTQENIVKAIRAVCGDL